MGRLLVDGLNVIRTDAALRERERRSPTDARAELLRLLRHPNLAAHQVVLVLDGAAPPGERLPHRGRVRALYGKGLSADQLIAQYAESGDVIVTNDRDLAAATLPAGPRVWSVEQLLTRIRPPTKRDTTRPRPPREKPAPPKPTRLRPFPVCPSCLFYERDDWLMLCEEDGALGRPRNYRDKW